MRLCIKKKKVEVGVVAGSKRIIKKERRKDAEVGDGDGGVRGRGGEGAQNSPSWAGQSVGGGLAREEELC